MPQPKTCGCRIEYSRDLHNDKMVYIKGPHIVFCPLHEQAEQKLIEGLAQMKLINGPDEECVIRQWKECKNHRWIHEVEALLAQRKDNP